MQLAFKASKLAYSTDVTEHSFTRNVFTMNVMKSHARDFDFKIDVEVLNKTFAKQKRDYGIIDCKYSTYLQRIHRQWNKGGQTGDGTISAKAIWSF